DDEDLFFPRSEPSASKPTTHATERPPVEHVVREPEPTEASFGEAAEEETEWSYSREPLPERAKRDERAEPQSFSDEEFPAEEPASAAEDYSTEARHRGAREASAADELADFPEEDFEHRRR